MKTIIIDCETYSEADLKKVGTECYANHPSTEVILWSLRAEGWPRALVFEEPNLWKLLRDLKKTNLIKRAKDEPLLLVHWGPFDREIMRALHPTTEWSEEPDAMGFWRGPGDTLWFDLSEISLMLGASGGLKHAAEFWADEEPKDPGTALITRFCKPQKTKKRKGQRLMPSDDPMRWEKFRSYAGQDSNSTFAVFEVLNALVEDSEEIAMHAPYRACVQRMNDQGIYIDRVSAARAVHAIQRNRDAIRTAVEEAYDVNLSAPAQIAHVLGLPDAQRETIEAFLESEDLTKEQEEIAEARLVVAGAATKKLDSMLHRAGPDGRVRGSFIYHGAWTRRLTSRGLQLQNFVRSKVENEFFDELNAGEWDDTSDVFAKVRKNIRGFLRASPGHIFVAADYSQIELRIAAWLAGEGWLVDALHAGQDVYKLAASKILGVPISEITPDLRQLFKSVELASQFGLSGAGRDGTGGLYARLLGEGIYKTPGECKVIIDAYRASHPAIVGAWAAMEDAAHRLILGPMNREIEVGRITLRRTEYALQIIRPSGFRQYLWFPEVTMNGDISYYARAKSGAMVVDGTYGAKMFQGAVQGTAADLMLEGMLTAEKRGFTPVMSVHDEVVTEVMEVKATKEDRVEELCELISSPVSWADGLPVKAEGWQGERFTK